MYIWQGRLSSLQMPKVTRGAFSQIPQAEAIHKASPPFMFLSIHLFINRIK